MSDCPKCGCDPKTARWATVIVDPETEAPREATEGELEELSDIGLSVDRCWIAAGPINE